MTVSSRRIDRSARIPWLDMARGACVLAVVLFHVCLFHYLPIASGSGKVASLWQSANSGLSALRMPLLLVVSGWLAATKIRSGLSNVRTRKAIAVNYWIYAMWISVLAALNLITGQDVANHMHSWGDYLTQLVLPIDTGLWFVFALAFYTVVLSLVRSVPPNLVVGVLIALSLGIHWVFGWNGPMWSRMLSLFVFFALGVYHRDRVQAFAADTRATMIATAGSLVTGVTYVVAPEPWDYPTFLVLSVFSAVTLLGWARLFAQIAAVRRAAQWIGQNTLGIYVIHIPLLALFAIATTPYADRIRSVVSSPVIGLAYPLVATAVVAVLSLVLERALKAIGLRWLFALPSPLAQRFRVPRHSGALEAAVNAQAVSATQLSGVRAQAPIR